MLYIFGFIAAAAVIFFAGKKLSYYGDMLGEVTGISKGWIGIILMASVTSLPELMVGISSVSIVGSADLAVGDIIGSCAFNLGILAMLDAFVPKRKPLFGVASQSHILNAGLGTILIALLGLFMFIPKHYSVLSWLSYSSILLIAVYLISIKIIYHNEKKHTIAEEGHQSNADRPSKSKILKNYFVFASMIIVAALTLPFFAEQIAEMSGLEQSFVGTFFLAFSTSLPEIAVSITAVRMGSINMAVGNLLGSNIFNILIIALDDVFYTKGPLLQDASQSHLLSIFSTIIMSLIVVVGLSNQAKEKRSLLAWDAIFILFIYCANLFLLFHFS